MKPISSIFFEDEDQAFTQWNIEDGIVQESLPKGTKQFKGWKVLDVEIGKQLVALDTDLHHTVIMHRVEAIIRN